MTNPTPTNPVFYLGTHCTNWLSFAPFPLFVSHRRLSRIKTLPHAASSWCLDSGGFSELSLYGQWRTSHTDYIAAVRRYSAEIGNLQWAAPQDWMCEPWMLEKTGLSLECHQLLTISSFLSLREDAPDLPWIPVLQGYSLADYERCIQMYADSDVDLWEYPTVGVGSVCRRQATDEIEAVFTALSDYCLPLHGFGVKSQGLKRIGRHLQSADSLSWSLAARRDSPLPGHTHKNCANCFEYASQYREKVLCVLP